MTNVQAPPAESTVAAVKTRRRKQGGRVLIVLAIIVLGIIGVGVWLIAGSDDPGTTLPAAGADTIDGYMTAIQDYDGEALIPFVTPGFEFEGYGRVRDVEDHAVTVTTEWKRIGFKVDRSGGLLVSGDERTYIVAEAQVISWDGIPDGIYGMSIFNLVELDGTWVIDYHEFIYEGLR